MRFVFPYYCLAFLAFLGVWCGALPVLARDPVDTGAVIFVYQRVDEDLYPANNISTRQFVANIQELIESGYNISPVPDIVAALRDGHPVPDKTIGITFDGAYRSAYEHAMPFLLANNIPFTVFFAPGHASSNHPQYMDWSDIRRLARYPLVTLGLHPATYTHISGDNHAEIRRQVNAAIADTRKELRKVPTLFAYPFGEYSQAYRDIVAANGFTAAFGQHSGAAWSGGDLFALPRFAMTESYSDPERFRMAAQALPMPVTEIFPDDPQINTKENNPPTFGFTLSPDFAKRADALSCFASEQGRLDVNLIGGQRIEIRAKKPFEGNRVRINCTMPGPLADNTGGEQRWHWFGMLLTQNIPGADVENELVSEPYDDITVPLPN